ncbi:NAD(+) synthase [Arboricoccus pini]|nr:NAD(+) synthase [Arboricoccus pini]
MTFHSLYSHGFVRAASCTFSTVLADPSGNGAAILKIAHRCHAEGVAVAVFPELSLSGYSIEDLLHQNALLDAVEAALIELCQATRELMPVLIVGAPLRYRGRLYNTAIALHRGTILGIVPKIYLPNYREFYERRHFASGDDVANASLVIGGSEVPFGWDLLFAATDLPLVTFGIEICEDMWIPNPPSSSLALAGAHMLFNLSGSPITIGRAEQRALLCRSQSARCLAAYIYSAAGAGESTTDLSWDGQTSIFENGALLAEGPRFSDVEALTIADIDLGLLAQERMTTGTFDDARKAAVNANDYRRVTFELDPPTIDLGLRRPLERFPFVPANAARLSEDCYEAYNIQVSGLVQRLRAGRIGKIVIGVSGGLDSTHALIVAAHAMDVLKKPRADILAYTLPGFATGEATKANAHRLMTALGVTARELDIRPAARLMLADLGHPFARGEEQFDVTFENVQAGLRTDYLFRLANMHDGIVLGTGDLSELALGWCTYGVGDQMSHYNVNAGVPKTLIQHLIRWVGATPAFKGQAEAVLADILATEISPELVPQREGQPLQSTESVIGPYALQDFNLFYTLRYGMRPSKIAFLAWHAWRDADAGAWPSNFPADRRPSYDLAAIKHWLTVFVRRFFAFSQFKRSALPNGPKVAAGGSLSPRGDWRAPSDGNARAWLADIERYVPDREGA